jgi:hypothetical protein
MLGSAMEGAGHAPDHVAEGHDVEDCGQASGLHRKRIPQRYTDARVGT